MIKLIVGFNFSNGMVSHNFVGWVLFAVQRTISRSFCIFFCKGQSPKYDRSIIYRFIYVMKCMFSKSPYSHLKFDTNHGNINWEYLLKKLKLWRLPKIEDFIKRWRCFPLWLTCIGEKGSWHALLVKRCLKWTKSHIEITLIGALMQYGSWVKIIPWAFIPLGVWVALELKSLDWACVSQKDNWELSRGL